MDLIGMNSHRGLLAGTMGNAAERTAPTPRLHLIRLPPRVMALIALTVAAAITTGASEDLSSSVEGIVRTATASSAVVLNAASLREVVRRILGTFVIARMRLGISWPTTVLRHLEPSGWVWLTG